MVAGSKRRSASNLEIKTLDYLVEICESSKNTRTSCLIALLYLSGRRINEVLELKKKDLIFTKDFLSFDTFNEKCFRTYQQGNFNLKREGIFQTWNPKEKMRITSKDLERFYEKINVSFSITSEAYKQLSPFLLDHIEPLDNEAYIFSKTRGTGSIGYGMAYQNIRKVCPDIWPHWLRHQRFSAVTEQLKDLPTADLIYSLKDFTKHHRTDSTLAYVHRMRNIEIRKTI